MNLFQCPIPLDEYPKIVMAHGGGGKLTHQLISDMFAPLFENEHLAQEHDGAELVLPGERIAFTTDSHVISPLFFPGGDIGSLAVYGTVNDLAMCGAKPLYLSLSFIIEEGFPMETLWRIARSIRDAADKATVRIVTGDTKVVNRSRGDELYINTSGIGIIEHELDIRPGSVRKGDLILINGDVGRHGIAIMATREGLEFETEIESDCAPLHGLVQQMLDGGLPVHCLRDLTRGGLASAVIEIAKSSGHHITLYDEKIPVREEVKAACEILGLDPIHVANEGRFVLFLPEKEAEQALEILQSHPLGQGASIIGEVTEGSGGMVVMQNEYGGKRILDMFSGEQLPRIC